MPAYPDSVDDAYEYWQMHVKLITALPTAVEKGEGTLDRKQRVMMTSLTPFGCLYSSGISGLLM
jgi:hypothetical protein